VIIDSGSTNKLVSTKMVEKLELETTVHLTLYKVSWLQKCHQVTVTKQFLVEFKIRGYKDEILCDVIPMEVYHVLLGRPWQYDKNLSMTEGGILTPWRRMIEHTCFYQLKRRR
jgi:hypothetical protein